MNTGLLSYPRVSQRTPWHETRTLCGGVVTEVGPRIGATAPVSKFGPESREHPVLRRRCRPASAPCRFRLWGLHASAAQEGRWRMELLCARCAGLDVHAKTVVACARIASGGAVT